MTPEVSGSPDGAGVAELVAVMHRLRSPGGCPWDAEQTHASLARYLLEEAHETADAIASEDRDHLREELGDVLLQVVFHARIAQEHPDAPFDLDDVARGIASKLRRRHPHVFGDVTVADSVEVSANWEQIKAAERAAKGHSQDRLERIPRSLPALSRAVETVKALDATGRSALLDERSGQGSAGEQLLALVTRMVRDGVDPDEALRGAVREVTDRARSAVAGTD